MVASPRYIKSVWGLYTLCLEKRCHPVFCSNFARCWLTTLQTHLYTTKNRSDPKRTSRPFKTVAQKYSPNLLWSFLFTDEKIYSGHTDKLAEWLTVRISWSRRDDKMHVCTQLACSHWQHQSASNKWLTLFQFDTCWSQTQRYWGVLIVTWCCYNSFCLPYVESQTSSSFSSRTVPQCPGTWGDQFFPTIFPNIEQF